MKAIMTVLGISMIILSSTCARAEEVAVEPQQQMEESVPFCVVCGPEEKMNAEELTFEYEYNGKAYAFCSESCLEAFKKNPEKYLKKDGESDSEEHGDHEGHDHGDEEGESHEGHNHK